MALESVLQAAGLTDKEARIYLAALELGQAPVLRIAQKAGIKRPTAYVTLGELQAKGLEPEAVAQALHSLRATEVERAQEVWRKKFGATPANATERAKQIRFLASRGFGADAIQKVVSGDFDE